MILLYPQLYKMILVQNRGGNITKFDIIQNIGT